MRGHVRTNGIDYYAPAIVLNQYEPNGELELFVWDSSSGNTYIPSYQIRDIGVWGDGHDRYMYELSSNVQDILFSAEEQMLMRIRLDDMELQLKQMTALITEMAKTIGKEKSQSQVGPKHEPSQPVR
jgi:hypothetical protein